jgi:uncharacterized protein (DUF488 family)
VQLVADVRRRRGVRGPQYVWANSRRLQAMLAEGQIAYEHHVELAPSDELRRFLYGQYTSQGIGQRSRTDLSPEYVERYLDEVLSRVDLDAFAASLPEVSALMCVEREPQACHRSLIAERLPGVEVRHLS